MNWEQRCTEAVGLAPDYGDILDYAAGGGGIVAEVWSLFDAGWTDDEILDEARARGVTPTLRLQRAAAAYLAGLRNRGPVEVGPVDLRDEPVARGLTRSQIIAAREAHYAEGNSSTAIHDRLSVSRSTLFRARQDLGLCPWPTD